VEWSLNSIGLLGLPCLAFLLGIWQMERKKQKEALIAQIRRGLSADAVPFPLNNLDQLHSMEYQRVSLRGHFIHEKEFFIYPRGRFDDGQREMSVDGVDRSSHGAHLITPFVLIDSSCIVLINRGWIPQSKMNPATRRSGQVKEQITLEAIVRRSETKSPFTGVNDPDKGLWCYKDVPEMAQFYGTEPIFLDAVYESTIVGGPIGGQTNVNIRNEHLQYIATWFSLGVIGIVLWIARFYK